MTRNRTREINVGTTQGSVLFGAFPDPLKDKAVQEVRIDQMTALEKAVPGAGVAKLIHEIVENYHAHEHRDELQEMAFIESHDEAEKVENLVSHELVGPGDHRALFPVLTGPASRQVNRWVEDREKYFLVWDQKLGSGSGDISNVRKVPRVRVSKRTIDGFDPGSAGIPKSAAATISALVADLKSNPTASALVESFASEPGNSLEKNNRLGLNRGDAVQEEIVNQTNNSILTNWRRFDLVSNPTAGRNCVVVTVERPDL